MEYSITDQKTANSFEKCFSASCVVYVRGSSGNLPNGYKVFEQYGIDTEEKCMDACLGPNGDGIMTSGIICEAGQFKDGKCRLTSYFLNWEYPLQNSSVSFLIRLMCYSSRNASKFHSC